MNRDALIEMARRNLAHANAGTVDQAPGVHRVAASAYVDPARWHVEMDRIFGRLPVVAAFSSELREPGAFRALSIGDVPVLVTRGDDGSARAFLNACSHRGLPVVEEGSGSGLRFTCPYHAWSYDNGGKLLGVYKAKDFGEVDKSSLGLKPLPVVERAGLVWVVLREEEAVDFDAFSAGYDRLLEALALGETTFVGRQEVAGPNWKIAYDGYLDLYHLPILHRSSFGPDFPNDALYDAFGPHQRVSGPNPHLRKLEDRPEAEWPLAALTPGIWTIFPHISVAMFDADGPLYMISQLLPGASPGESRTIQNFLAVGEVPRARQQAIEEQMDFLLGVVRDEDYATGLKIQRALSTGLTRDVLFGRNEWGGQRFHRWVDALVSTEDADLGALFERGAGGDPD